MVIFSICLIFVDIVIIHLNVFLLLVINFDMPAEITNYNHRIGRTGRAGKSGIAITYLTSTDTEVMYSLKSYLESTGSVIPQELMHNEAAKAPPGARRDDGKLIGQKRDSVQFSSK
jgi:ATP-dependent RNA helicase DDX23/PRP28